MIRGTTAPFKFALSRPFEEVSIMEVQFWQKHHMQTPIVKRYDMESTPTRNDGFAAVSPAAKEVQTNLNPEETLRFSDKEKGYVQIQAYYGSDGFSEGSLPQKFTVYPTYSNDPIVIPPAEPVDDYIYVFDAGELSGGE